MKNRDFRSISRFISEMMEDRAIVTMEKQGLLCDLSNIAQCCFSDLAKYPVLHITEYFAKSLKVTDNGSHTSSY